VDFTAAACGALEACVVILHHLISNLPDKIIMEHLKSFSKEIISPLTAHLSSLQIRSERDLEVMTSSSDHSYPHGVSSRKSICEATTRLLITIVMRIGREMSRLHLSELIRDYFRNFDLSHRDKIARSRDQQRSVSDEEPPLEGDVWLSASLTTDEDQIPNIQTESSQSRSLLTPCDKIDSRRREVEETFCPETAYHAYVYLSRVMGSIHMAKVLGPQHELIVQLYQQHEKTLEKSYDVIEARSDPIDEESLQTSNVVGNQIICDQSNIETIATTSKTRFHLRNNWLLYWEHGIGLPEKDQKIRFNQIFLSSLNGHSSVVRCIEKAASETWLMTGSKDKTVRIWNLNYSNNNRSNYEEITSDLVYRHHKRGVSHIKMIESLQKVVSCDGSIHIWDPYIGKQMNIIDTSDMKSAVVALDCPPAPSRCFLAAFADSSVKMFDVRMRNPAQEFKTLTGQSLGGVK